MTGIRVIDLYTICLKPPAETIEMGRIELFWTRLVRN